MTNFRNLKIAINDQQPLEDVVRELERLGYTNCGLHHEEFNQVVCYMCGFFHYLKHITIGDFKETTLAELKEM